MENKDYGELFCEAVDTIVKQRLESVSFDSTILCTIVDDSLRDSGTYTVTNNGGITKFDAYTNDTSLRNNNNVYVQIPGGDWNQQKIILAKKTDTNKEPYVYKKPFSSLVDITGNLISSNINSNETGLIANAEGDEYEAVTLWSYNVDESKALRKEEGETFASYTRLGIQADFQSWLNPFYPLVNTNEEMTDEELEDYSLARYVVEGDYGLRLRVMTESEAISKDTEEKTSIYDLYLNCEDMNGNPYDFASFFSQEKVFNISTIGKIIKMELQFYQTKNSFKDRDGLEIPFKDFLGHYIKPNLYVKDVYISLGYDVEEFDQEMVQIYTLNSTTYARTADPLTKNHKKIQLRWIHKQEDGSFKSISLTDNLNYRIQWYKYELGHSSADDYSGVYWKFLSSQETEGANTSSYDIQDEDWKLYNKTCDDGYRREPSFLTSWCIPDVTLQEEQIKAILFYGDKIYRSNILICTNEDEVVSKPTVDAVQALSINCDDNTYGNYRIYNQGNSLIDAAQAQIQREWIPYFKSSNEKEDAAPTELIEAESIEWIIPTKKTMIVIDKSFYGGEDLDNIEVSEDADSRLHIKRYGSGPRGNVFENGRNHQLYRIRSYYSQTYSDNTIQCKVVKDKITYTAVKELTFGVAGTTGTDCTFILDFDNGITAVTDNPNKAVTVTARLYDYENNEIEDFLTSGNRTIKWSWKTSDGKLHFVANEKRATAEIKRGSANWSTNDYSNYNILQATLQGWGDFELTAYLPIPIRSEETYAYISGTTQVIYNSDGEVLDYFKNPYILYRNDSTLESNLTWEIVNSIQKETDANYTPKLKQDTKTKNWYLEPLSFYVEDSCEKICVKAKTTNGTVIWSQPILILQNRYPSAMVNKWDGSLDIGTNDPGTILAPRLVAGKKDKNDNTFSGVMLGDWGSTASDGSLTNKQTGLYGFDHGEQSYAFRQDGTAFIGKSGTGRINFDGTQGLIESEGFNDGSGMQINLAKGKIDAHQFTLTAGKNKSDQAPELGKDNTILINTEADNIPFSIGSNFSISWDGTINAKAGNIGVWTIDDYGLISQTGETKLYADGELVMGFKPYSVIINQSGITLGNVSINQSGITLGTSPYQATITSSGITLGKGDYQVTITSSGISLGSEVLSTFIGSEGMNTQKVRIYSKVGWNSLGAFSGSLEFAASDFGSNSELSNYQGIGLVSQNKKNILKVTDIHVGATNGSATWTITSTGFHAVMTGEKKNQYVEVNATEVKISDLNVTGTTKGVYATLA